MNMILEKTLNSARMRQGIACFASATKNEAETALRAEVAQNLNAEKLFDNQILARMQPGGMTAAARKQARASIRLKKS